MGHSDSDPGLRGIELMDRKDRLTVPPVGALTERHRRAAGGMRAGGDAETLVAAEGHQVGGQHGTLRAAVFGMNDGLVSNLSLMWDIGDPVFPERFTSV